MAEIKVELPKELDFIEKAPDIDWSLLVSKLISSKLERISRFRKIVAKSKLTEKDVKELSDKINKSLSERYLE